MKKAKCVSQLSALNDGNQQQRLIKVSRVLYVGMANESNNCESFNYTGCFTTEETKLLKSYIKSYSYFYFHILVEK